METKSRHPSHKPSMAAKPKPVKPSRVQGKKPSKPGPIAGQTQRKAPSQVAPARSKIVKAPKAPARHPAVTGARRTGPAPAAESPEESFGTSEAPRPKISVASRARLAEAAKIPAPVEVEEDEAWRTYQADSAEAWKKYQARTLTRAAYDEEIKRAWNIYSAAARGGSGPASGRIDKSEALANLRTWLQLEFCNSRSSRAGARLAYGISGPAAESGGAFAGLLDRFVRTVASDEEQRRIEHELRDYGNRDVDDIDARIETLQRRLDTRDVQRAYAGSWCSRS